MTGPVIHVLDASRAVGVASQLLSDTQADAFVEATAAEYQHVRDVRGQGSLRAAQPGRRARQRLQGRHGDKAPPPAARRARVRGLGPGRSASMFRLDPVLPRLGTGRQLPGDPLDDRWSAKARGLFADAQAMLDQIVSEKWLTARASPASGPARATATTWSLHRRRWHMSVCRSCASRSQEPRPRQLLPCRFHRPGWRLDRRLCRRHPRHRPHLARFKAEHDDYSTTSC
jgi:5-methyltetrahydrofolate--homocysteine methyltransferase